MGAWAWAPPLRQQTMGLRHRARWCFHGHKCVYDTHVHAHLPPHTYLRAPTFTPVHMLGLAVVCMPHSRVRIHSHCHTYVRTHVRTPRHVLAYPTLTPTHRHTQIHQLPQNTHKTSPDVTATIMRGFKRSVGYEFTRNKMPGLVRGCHRGLGQSWEGARVSPRAGGSLHTRGRGSGPPAPRHHITQAQTAMW